jgi:hypothetical protein
LILSPLPPALTIPLGIDASRAAFQAFRQVAERFDGLGIVAPVLHALLEKRSKGEEDVAAVLGFNPLELLRKLLVRDR